MAKSKKKASKASKPQKSQKSPASKPGGYRLETRAPPEPRQTFRPPTPPPPPPGRFSKYTPMARRVGLVIAFGSVWTMGFYIFSVYKNINKDPAFQDVPADVADRYDRIANNFDKEVGWYETYSGINRKRKNLCKMAKGDVLEVSAGTGRNIAFYDTKACKSITLLDLSGPMLEIAKEKWRQEHPEYSNVDFRVQSALEPIASPNSEGFDTVAQTMGICSTPEPVKLLQHLGQITKEDGQILLLEHGKAHYQWLNNYLDKAAPAHADKFGCWFNKDIGEIVQESGLEVVKIKRYHLGTLWQVELKPGKKSVTQTLAEVAIPQARSQKTETPSSVVSSVHPQPQKPWWKVW